MSVSLKSKITIPVFFLIFAGFVGLAALAYVCFTGEFKSEMAKQQLGLIAALGQQLDDKLALAQRQLVSVASDINPQDLLQPERLQKILDNKKETRIFFDAGFRVVDRKGRLLAGSPRSYESLGRTCPAEEYVSKTFRTGSPAISTPYRISLPGEFPVVSFTAPIKAGDGTVVAVISGRMRLTEDSFITKINRLKIGDHGYFSLITEGRVIVTHPDSSYVLKTVRPGLNRAVDRAIAGFEGITESPNLSGVDGFAMFKHLKNVDWILAAHYPRSEVYGPIMKIRTKLIVAIALIDLILATVIWLVMARITAPLIRFTRHVASLPGKVGEDKYFRDAAADEIGTLAETFNAMVGELERQQMELQTQKNFAEKLISNATAPIFVLDSLHRIVFWNKACEKLTGFMAEAMIGTERQWEPFYSQRRPTLADVIISHDQEKLPELYDKSSPSTLAKEGLQSEGWYSGLGGKDRYIFFEAAPIRNADDALVAVIETLQDITERKIAEDNVILLKDFYLSLFEEFPAFIWRAGTDAKCNYLNKTWLDFTGRTLEQDLGDGWAEGVHPEDRDYCLATYLEASEARRPFRMEYRLRRWDGVYRWVVNFGRPFNDFDGVFAGYIGSCYDITESREAEESLRKLSRAVEQSPASIVITDVRGGIEYVNPKFTQLTGYEFEEVQGKNPRIMKSDANPPEVYEELWRAITSGREWRGELLNRKKSGERYWENVTIAPVSDTDGVITHFLAIKEDITARKEAEEALRQSREKLEKHHEQLSDLFLQVQQGKREWEQTLDCISDLVILVDEAERVRRCNLAVVELVGKPFDDILGTDWRTLLLAPDIETRGRTQWSMQFYHSQSEKWFYLTYYPIKDDDISGAVITFHDFTELKRASEALETALKELKEAHSQMLQKEKMASIGQLAAGVAHEINNPIGFVNSNLGTLDKYVGRMIEFIQAQGEALSSSASQEVGEVIASQRKKLKLDYIIEDSRKLIQESLDGTDRVRKIVQNLKSFSRVDESEYKRENLNNCLESTLNIVWNELKYKATVEREYGELPETRCYPQQLNQVFMNLLVNAAHAIESQGTITIRSWAEGADIFIAISDTGSGIPDELHSRIFEPFFTTKEVGKGTGLGLSISYDIVKKHGGEILLESVVGEGTTFTVRLPVTD
ncbi:PAS domain S-box protein [Geobacter argillaceus]|uniref:histidine kinase n=1 Tax=Geobacter argillaceus TaxID=345631 RepID=A0A562VNJ8_9BACT|nr:PAS domain S-box protein [Geobacter argillaceus]TWJ19458.1 two-component system NtrC family sensor kinase [Geobacter argillaceus]